MHSFLHTLMDLGIILILIFGIWQFRSPKGARTGNLTAALAIACGFLLVIYRNGVLEPWTVLFALIIGSIAGYLVAMRVNMIQIPALIAFQHGAGGIAAFLISYVELTRTTIQLAGISKLSGFLGLVIGAATFSGSMIASGKLANKIKQTPVVLPAHNIFFLFTIGLILVLGVSAWNSVELWAFLLALIALSIILGIVFSIRIGGADMPVLISFLNATAGLAAAFCGIAIQNRLLIACGATVAASGSILTHVMCRSMNRGLINIFTGIRANQKSRAVENTIPLQHIENKPSEKNDVFSLAVKVIRNADKIIIIPGYGMALAQAQFEVAALAKQLEDMGKDIRFAIHPVAGRMPGHMNVLLAEAEIEYDKLFEMDIVNPEFCITDLALVIGASDVVNPAATDTEGTPISGMPILKVHEAETVIVCNLDDKPGYSGVDNTLYTDKKSLMLLGDAKISIRNILQALMPPLPEETPVEAHNKPQENGVYSRVIDAIGNADKIIIIPGYGMALAQAQFEVAALAKRLEDMGKDVRFAIHPVAGRMPGHMNVLLAEAEIEYDKLIEMDSINPEFSTIDLALVIGASDVVNPAATDTEGTPISGMPILKAHEAKTVIVCNLDDKPGYSGVLNSLYSYDKTIMLTGDAGQTLQIILQGLAIC